MKKKPVKPNKPVETGEEQERKPGTFTKDDPRINREGRPQGSLDFKTKWFAMVDKLAKANNVTADDINEQLLAVGYKQAKDGNYSFWRELNERLYGKVQDKLDITTLGKEVNADDDKLEALAHKLSEELKKQDESA